MINIRRERPADYAAVEALTFAAFETMQIPGHPYTNEHILVRLLRYCGDDNSVKELAKEGVILDSVPELDLVAELDGEIVGHIIYSRCWVIRPDGTETEALVFGPLSVKPKLHRQGIGSLLVEHSLSIAKKMGFGAVLITGHPDYYKRFDFAPASRFGITMPDGASFDAFMALELKDGYLGTEGGKWRLCRAFEALEELDSRRVIHTLGTPYELMSEKEIADYKKSWVEQLVPPEKQEKAAECYLLPGEDGYSDYLWHAFSFELVDALCGDAARTAFDEAAKGSAVLISAWDEAGYLISDSSRLTAAVLDEIIDVVITDSDFGWTYAKPHEEYLGPYFFRG